MVFSPAATFYRIARADLPIERKQKYFDRYSEEFIMSAALMGGRGAAKGASNWTLGAFKSEAKWASQMTKRGWTPEQITEAIQKGKACPAENLVNKGNPAVRYVHPKTGRSVVVDPITREVIHVGGDGFKY